ncbi:MAG: NAD-dependent deacylase [Myxococcota bacterium]
MGSELQELRALIQSRRPLTVLTGAGISAESGVPTFRDGNGLWRNHDPMEIATPEAFNRDPKLSWEFYQERRAKLVEVAPNLGHHAVAAFQARRPETALITQNVDALHREAGSDRLIEMHGCIWNVRCTECRFEEENRHVDLHLPPRCPDCGALLRPDIMWFGEHYQESMMDEIEQLLGRGGIMLVVGTSGHVHPAAAFAGYARQQGAFCIEINPNGTLNESDMDVVVRAPAGEVLPLLLETKDLEP